MVGGRSGGSRAALFAGTRNGGRYGRLLRSDRTTGVDRPSSLRLSSLTEHVLGGCAPDLPRVGGLRWGAAMHGRRVGGGRRTIAAYLGVGSCDAATVTEASGWKDR